VIYVCARTGCWNLTTEVFCKKHRAEVDASDMKIIEVQGAILSPPKIVGTMFVEPPTFPKGTVTVVKNLSGVLVVEEAESKKGDVDEPRK